MDVQNENLLFLSLCNLFHRVLLDEKESLQSQSLISMSYFERGLESEMRNRVFMGWKERFFHQAVWLLSYPNDRDSGKNNEWKGQETGILIRDGHNYSLLDFCVFLSEKENGAKKAIRSCRKNSFANLFVVERYLFAIEFQGMDIRKNSAKMLNQLPNLECVAMNQYPVCGVFCKERIGSILPANMYLLKVLDGNLLR